METIKLLDMFIEVTSRFSIFPKDFGNIIRILFINAGVAPHMLDRMQVKLLFN